MASQKACETVTENPLSLRERELMPIISADEAICK